MAKRRARLDVQLAVWFVIMLILSFLLVRLSIITAHVRAVFVVTAFAGFITAAAFVFRVCKKRVTASGVMVLAVVLPVVWLSTGGRDINSEALRKTYRERLHSFENTHYRWGGETSYGIDCSGIARVALWQAMVRQGVKDRNPRLLGPELWKFWWRDLSAQAMRNGTYGYTRVIDETPRLAGYDTSLLKPGDLAVMNTGIHVLVYYGDGRWIEASPEDGKVVTNPAPEDTERGWFTTGPVKILRWWVFE